MGDSDFKLSDFEELFPEIKKAGNFLADLKSLRRRNNYPKHEFAACLHDFHLKKDNHKGYKDNPEGYLYRVILNAIKKWRKESEKLDMDIELPENFDNSEFDEIKDSIQKIVEFSERVRSDAFLSIRELELFEIITETAKEEHNTYREFWDDAYQTALEDGFSDDNIRQIISRLRSNFKRGEPGNDLKDMLHLVPVNQDMENSKYLNMIDELEMRLVKNVNTNLKAYRFSDAELEKMLWLKGLFAENNFKIDRFPEVYYDTLDNARIFYNIPDLDKFEGTIDYLGIYIYEVGKDISEATKEGIVILFEDNIKKYCKSKNLTIDSVRFVVLMHEIGHWLTHWPAHDAEKKGDINEENWTFGFQMPYTKTHEALANLIAFWTCQSDETHKLTLQELSPKNADGTIDINDPYGAYIELISAEKETIIKKLIAIRNAFYLKDEKMFEFLKADDIELREFLVREKLNEYVDADFLKIFTEAPFLASCSMKVYFELPVDKVDLAKGAGLIARLGGFDDEINP
jgi:hypothetical protein